jgi:hypothetical protein
LGYRRRRRRYSLAQIHFAANLRRACATQVAP